MGETTETTTGSKSKLNDALEAVDAEMKELLRMEGQTLEMWALTGSGCGFYVSISGDCYLESFSRESPLQAMLDVIQKYKTWSESSL